MSVSVAVKSAAWCLSILYSPCMSAGSFPLVSAETESESAVLTRMPLSGGRVAAYLFLRCTQL